MVSLIDFLTNSQYPSQQEADLAFLTSKKPQQGMGGGGLNFRFPSIPGIQGPQIQGPSVQGPTAGPIQGPTVGPIGGPVQTPSVQLPSLPSVPLGGGGSGAPVGLPSLNLGNLPINLPSLPGVGQVPLPSTGGVGISNGQLTYNPTPTQAINTATDISNIVGGSGNPVSQILGQAGGFLSDVVAPVSTIWAVGQALNSIFGANNWAPATAQEKQTSLVSQLGWGKDPSKGNTSAIWAALSPDQQSSFVAEGEKLKNYLSSINMTNLNDWASLDQGTKDFLIQQSQSSGVGAQSAQTATPGASFLTEGKTFQPGIGWV